MEDQRIRSTKNAVKVAFTDLLKKKNIDQITVSEICAHAGINRATFYRYYTGPYDLLDHLQEEVVSEVASLVKDKDFDLETMLGDLFCSMYKNRKNLIPIFSGYSRRLYSRMEEYLEELFVVDSKSEIEQMSFHFLIHGICGLFSDWVSTGMKMDPETFTKNTFLLCRSMYNQYNKDK